MTDGEEEAVGAGEHDALAMQCITHIDGHVANKDRHKGCCRTGLTNLNQTPDHDCPAQT